MGSRCLDGIQQIIQTVSAGRTDRDDRYLQLLRQLLHINVIAAANDLIHHVQSDHHRSFQLHQL